MRKYKYFPLIACAFLYAAGSLADDGLSASAEADGDEAPAAVEKFVPEAPAENRDEAQPQHERAPERDYYGRVNSSGRQLYQRIDVPCAGAGGGYIVNGQVGICKQVGGPPGISGIIETDQKYLVTIVGVGISVEGKAGAFGFVCESKTNDPDWEKNFPGVYYGYKGSLTYLAGGQAGLFFNKRGQCMITGLQLGAGADLSAAVIYIKPIGKKQKPSTVSK